MYEFRAALSCDVRAQAPRLTGNGMKEAAECLYGFESPRFLVANRFNLRHVFVEYLQVAYSSASKLLAVNPSSPPPWI